LVGELADATADNLLDIDALDFSGMRDEKITQLTPHLKVTLALLTLEPRVVQDLNPLLGCLLVFALRYEKLNELLGVLGVNLHVPPPNPNRRLSRCRVSEREVQFPYPRVLSKR
jgi:hypothetical protein